MFFKIALLNIFKHLKRSIIVFMAVVIAVFMMCLVSGLLRGISDSFTSDLLPNSGHLQLRAAGAKNAPNPYDLKYLIKDADQLLLDLQDKKIVHLEKIFTFGAMVAETYNEDISKPSNSMFMMGQGVLPDTIYQRNITQNIQAGGRFISDNNEEIVLGKKAADLLGYKLGDKVDILTSDRSGAPINHAYTLVGVFRTGNDQVDENQFFITHVAAETLEAEEGKTREIRVTLTNPDEALEMKNTLEPELKHHQSEVQTWQEIFGSLLAVVKLMDVVNLAINLFFIIIAVSVITNSILMTVFERIREFGTLRAIGLKARQTFAMILTESALLGILGSAVGLLLSIPALLYFKANGLDIGDATNYMGVGSRLYASIHPIAMLMAFLSGVIITILAGWYAGRVSSKLTVTESLAHI